MIGLGRVMFFLLVSAAAVAAGAGHTVLAASLSAIAIACFIAHLYSGNMGGQSNDR